MENGQVVHGVVSQIKEDFDSQDYTSMDEMFAQLIKKDPENRQILINYLGDRMVDKINDGSIKKIWEIHEEDYIN